MNILVTTTWNNETLIGTFLDHYQKLGFDRILLMDFNSVDGTLDIVHSQQYRNFVQFVPFPGFGGLDSSQLMLEIARESYTEDTGCLFCDPDELLVLPLQSEFSVLKTMAGAVMVPRFNVTAFLSAVLSDPENVTAKGSLNLRIDITCPRTPSDDILKANLDPPWIYTAIPGKVFVRLGKTVAIDAGDHSAILRHGEVQPAAGGGYLLHYPIRTYQEFAEKVRMYGIYFDLNPQLPEWWGWQARRWVRIAREGRLREEYEQQFPTDVLADHLIRTRALVLDNKIRILHL